MFTRRFAALVAISLAAACTSSPQTTDLTGTVLDASTGEPLEGVTLSVGQQSSQSDSAGAFSLSGVVDGSDLKASICSHEESVSGVPASEEGLLELDAIELQPLAYKVQVVSNLTDKGIRARFSGAARGKTRNNGTAVIRGLCPDSNIRFAAPGYETARTSLQAAMDITLQAGPGATAEYHGELDALGRSKERWRFVHPDVKAYASQQDFVSAVREDALNGYQVISVDVKSYKIIRWVNEACEYSDYGPKVYPRTAAVEVIYHWAEPNGGASTDRAITHWVQTKDGLWRWFANVGCSFPAP